MNWRSVTTAISLLLLCAPAVAQERRTRSTPDLDELTIVSKTRLSDGQVEAVIRNDSAKAITAFALSQTTADSEGRTATSKLHGEESVMNDVLGPGEIKTMRLGFIDDEQAQHGAELSVNFVIFSDTSSYGNREKIDEVFANRAGSLVEYTKALRYLDSSPTSSYAQYAATQRQHLLRVRESASRSPVRKTDHFVRGALESKQRIVKNQDSLQAAAVRSGRTTKSIYRDLLQMKIERFEAMLRPTDFQRVSSALDDNSNLEDY